MFESFERTQRPAFFTQRRTISWMDWLGIVESSVERFEPLRGARTGLLFRSSEISYALLSAPSLLEWDLFVIDERTSHNEIEELATLHKLDALIDPCGGWEQIEISDLTIGSQRSRSERRRSDNLHFEEYRSTQGGSPRLAFFDAAGPKGQFFFT